MKRERDWHFMRSNSILSKISLALLAASLSFLLIRYAMGKSPTDAGRAFGVVLGLGLLTRMLPQSVIERATTYTNRIVSWSPGIIFCIVFAALASTHAIVGLGLHPWQGFDIGFFVQATHNAFSEKALMFKNIDGNFSFFGHHFSPFLFLLAPLGKASEAPFLLYLVQDFAFALAAALFAKLVTEEKKLPPAAKGLALLLAFGHPFWLGLAYYEFHELSFAPAFVLFLFMAYRKRNSVGILMSTIALLSIKETAIFSVAFFGFLLVMTSKEKRLKATGIAVCALSAAVFFLYFKMIMPNALSSTINTAASSDTKAQTLFIGYFSHLGNSIAEVILSPIQRPLDFAKAVFTLPNAVYVSTMFLAVAPLLFLVPRAALVLLPVLPDFAITLLSQGENVKHYGNQYAGLVLVPVLLSACVALREWNTWSEQKRRVVVAWTVACSVAFLYTNPIRIWKLFFFSPEGGLASRPFVAALREVPKEVPLVAMDEPLLPFVGQRENLIWMPQSRFKADALAPGMFLAWKPAANADVTKRCLPESKLVWGEYALCRIGETQ